MSFQPDWTSRADFPPIRLDAAVEEGPSEPPLWPTYWPEDQLLSTPKESFDPAAHILGAVKVFDRV